METSSKRCLHILKDIIKSSFKKIQIKKNKMKPELEKLFKKKEDLKLEIASLQNSNRTRSEVEDQIGQICAEQNKSTVEEYLKPYDD